MFFGAPKALCFSWQSVARHRASIATINWEFLALLDYGTLTVTGQGVGVLENRSIAVASDKKVEADRPNSNRISLLGAGDRLTSSITSRFRAGFIRPHRFRFRSPNTDFFEC
jgi:hypothetical protein